MPHPFKPVKTPLYQQVLTHLRGEIARLSPGSRLEPEHAMAARFSVSVVTIREALRILASENMIERHAGRGTFVSEGAPAANTGHVAILIDQDVSHPQSSPVYLRMAQTLREHLAGEGVGSRLYVGNNPPGVQKPDLNSPEFLIDLKEGKISGVAALLAQPSRQWLDEVERQQLPVVAFGHMEGYANRCEFVADYLPRSLEMLRAQGCRTVGFVGWFGHAVDPAPHLANLCREIERLGMETRLSWVRHDGNPCEEGAGWEKFRELWRAETEKPQGVIISDDLLFKSVIPAIPELGIAVPEELRLVVRTNKGIPLLCPFPISRLEADPKECAIHLGEKLLTLLAGKPLDEPLTHVPLVALDEWSMPQMGKKGRSLAKV
ncbi:MAG TPA: GntR family transcriptional regulator [Chthoniobacteraceae bacterium]|nr:GntR family transcriptional regulator [Chthoniobacteraceae bacterium]